LSYIAPAQFSTGAISFSVGTTTVAGLGDIKINISITRGGSMGLLTALGIVIGILVAIWVYISVGIPSLGLIVWVGVIGWATFYAAGGGMAALKKGIVCNIAGAVIAGIAATVAGMLPGGLITLCLLLAVAVFIMCVMAKVDLLSFIPGSFLGAAAFFGSGVKLDASIVMLLVSLVCGVVLGYISEAGAKAIAKP
jgi:Protein of unknown function (DUF1097)